MNMCSSQFGRVPSQATKRRVFFSFHFDDIMRVNNVRQAWKIHHPDAPLMRSFYDSSLWESRQLEGEAALKRLIRDGVGNTSAVCVLVGTDTWTRRWVKYEIARAVIDNRGLLAVHLNNLNHHVTRLRHPPGHNPLNQLAIGKVQPNAFQAAQYYIFEYKNNGWVRYQDYTDPVQLPPYLADPLPGYITQLSGGTTIHDFKLHDGHRDLGSWIDQAAIAVGR